MGALLSGDDSFDRGHRGADPRSGTSPSSSFGQHPVILFLALAGCMAAIGGIAALIVTGRSSSIPGPEIAADVMAPAAALPSEFDSLPHASYAGLRVALVEARTVPDNRSGAPIVVLDLVITNNTDRQARLPRSMFRLDHGSGEEAPISRFEYGRYEDRMVVEPGTNERSLAVFYLPPWVEVDLDAYSLEFGEPGRRPVDLPLDGTSPLPDEPRPLTFDDSTDTPVAEGSVQLVSATAQAEYESYRAKQDHDVAVLVFDAAALGRQGAVDLADAQKWRVIATIPDASGLPSVSQPARVSVGKGGTAEGTTLTVVASYPLEAARLELTIEVDGTTREVAQIDVTPAG